jgi:hypothetical protein
MSSRKDGGARVQKLDGDMDDKGHEVTNPIKLDDTAQALIGHQLRALYGQIIGEPVPAHLIKLLQDLESKEQDDLKEKRRPDLKNGEANDLERKERESQ